MSFYTIAVHGRGNDDQQRPNYVATSSPTWEVVWDHDPALSGGGVSEWNETTLVELIACRGMEYELGQFQEMKLVSCFRGDEFGVSSVAFDLQEDLLWAATFGVSRGYIRDGLAGQTLAPEF